MLERAFRKPRILRKKILLAAIAATIAYAPSGSAESVTGVKSEDGWSIRNAA